LDDEPFCLQIALVEPRNRSIAEYNEEFGGFEPTPGIFWSRKALLDTELFSFCVLPASHEFVIGEEISKP